MPQALIAARWESGNLVLFEKATGTAIMTVAANGDVTVAGTLGAGSQVLDGEIDDDVAITGTLDVAGATALASTLAVTGATTLSAALGLAAAGFTMAAIARTATAAGLTTGTIASGPALQFISVTASDANHIVILPAPTPGVVVILHVAATGFELRTSDPATIGINGGTGADAESAIPANTTVLMICATATSWKGLQLGSDGTLAKVEVAA